MNKDSGTTERPPVVVVMGHVDHGKTTLLDYIRKANVAGKEAGGITQAVGAYEIEHNGKKVTFIDTPGHEAFSKMRSRGAGIADIAILIVAADDGVNVQTKEVIEILKKAEIPFIVAINKIDKNNADIEKTKSDLAKNGVLLEGFGGSVSFQPISAKTGEGVDDLIELLLLATEMEELTYTPKAPAKGFILESHIDKFSGITATAIIKDGELNIGDGINAGSATGKVKGLKNFLGKGVKELEASSPAVILGFCTLPEAGSELCEENDKDFEPECLTTKVEKGQKEISFIIKASVAGSLEAIVDAIKKIVPPDEDSSVCILSAGVGDVTDGDVKMALSSEASIIAFDVRETQPAKALAKVHSVRIYSSPIIYKIIEEIEEEFKKRKGSLIAGDLEILMAFDSKNPEAQVIGGKVVEGEIKNQTKLDVSRGNKVIGSGSIVNLQIKKKDAQLVEAGNECGMLFNSETIIKKGDHLIARPE